MYDLEGKVAIVTGAGRRGAIGATIAIRLAREGAVVVVADLCAPVSDLPTAKSPQWEELQAVAHQVEQAGGRSLAVRADVTDPLQVQEMVARAMETFGRVDILVNNAGGVVAPSPVIQMPEEAWRKTLEINATGTFLCSKAVLPAMIEGGRGGRIVNMASAAAKAPKPFMAHYAAAKAAVVAFTRALAQEVAEHGITVNAVLPGDVDTALKRWGFQLEAAVTGKPYDQVVAECISRIPMGRLVTPDDVADLVAFLVSDQAGMITGQALNISGGRVLH